LFTGSGCGKTVVGRDEFEVEFKSDVGQEMRIRIDVINGLPQYRSHFLLDVMLKHSTYIVLIVLKYSHHTEHRTCNIYQTVQVSACEGIDKYAYT